MQATQANQTRKIAAKTAERIASLYNSVFVAELMLKDIATGNDTWRDPSEPVGSTVIRWNNNRTEAIEQLREMGIPFIDY